METTKENANQNTVTTNPTTAELPPSLQGVSRIAPVADSQGTKEVANSVLREIFKQRQMQAPAQNVEMSPVVPSPDNNERAGKKKPCVQVHAIAKAVCRIMDITDQELRDNSHRGRFALARQIVCYLSREVGAPIGETLEIINTTSNGLVYAGHQKIAKRLSNDSEVMEIVQKAQEELYHGSVTDPKKEKTTASLVSVPKSLKGLVAAVVHAVASIVCAPILFSKGEAVLNLGSARAAAYYLLFDKGVSPEEIAALVDATVDVVHQEIGRAVVSLRDATSEVARIVKEAKKRL